jgi:hypothetical protein
VTCKQKIAILALFFTCVIPVANAQELEPRAYANLPVGANAFAAVYGYASGNILTDPSKPIKGAKLRSHNLGLGYVRTFGLLKRLARMQVSIPLIFLAGKGTLNGRDTSIARSGFGDARIRLGINLIGSPALDRKHFSIYNQNTILGVSLVTSVPTGLYYKEKIFNLGSHRWAFKPEIGISRRFKHVYAEAYAGVWFYTKNKRYLVDKIQEQEPVLTMQAHLCYYFKNQMWLGVNGNWFNGGMTKVNGVASGNLEDNWRVGGTWSFPVARAHSLKLQVHVGAFTNTGYDYNIISLAYQYLFF